jgi:uncharacterized protein (TIGR02466 family)
MIAPWFPTPMYISEITGDAFDSVQTELMAAYQKTLPSMSKNPKWERDTHSLSDITFSRNLLRELDCQKTMDAIGTHVGAYIAGLGLAHCEWTTLSSWITQTRQHEFARAHAHIGADIAGVYYLDTNGEDGNLYFKSPNALLMHSFLAHNIPNEHEIIPKTGKIALWPAYLEHGTRTNTTEHDRLSISFNIVIKRPWA